MDKDYSIDLSRRKVFCIKTDDFISLIRGEATVNNLPTHCDIAGVNWDVERHSFCMNVVSNDFDLVLEGNRAEVEMIELEDIDEY